MALNDTFILYPLLSADNETPFITTLPTLSHASEATLNCDTISPDSLSYFL